MAILFTANGESADGLQGSFTYSTSSNSLRTGSSRAAYQVEGSSLQEISAEVAPQTRFVAKRHIAQNSNLNMPNKQWFTEVRDGANARIRCHPITPDALRVQVVSVDGASEIELFVSDAIAPTPIGNGSITVGDLELDINYVEEGWVRLYQNEALIGEFIGDPRRGASTTLDSIGMRSMRSSASWGEHRTVNIIIANESLVGKNLFTLVANGAGAVNDWTGAHTAINETGAPNSSYISTDTADDEYLFNYGDLNSSLEPMTLRSLFVKALVLRGATGPDEYAQQVRHDSVNYQGTPVALSEGYTLVTDEWEVNPGTAQPWTRADVNAAQIGGVALQS